MGAKLELLLLPARAPAASAGSGSSSAARVARTMEEKAKPRPSKHALRSQRPHGGVVYRLAEAACLRRRLLSKSIRPIATRTALSVSESSLTRCRSD